MSFVEHLLKNLENVVGVHLLNVYLHKLLHLQNQTNWSDQLISLTCVPICNKVCLFFVEMLFHICHIVKTLGAS